MKTRIRLDFVKWLILGVLCAGPLSTSVLASPPETNNALPVVTWILPTNGASFSSGAPIFLTAQAIDTDGTIGFVDFYRNGAFMGRGTGFSTNGLYSLTWTNPPVGIFQLQAQARDNALARGTSSPVQIVVNVATNSPPTNTVPVVTWIRPTNGAAFAAGTPILLTAEASDPGGSISYVDFYSGTLFLGRALGSFTNSFYNLTWTNPPAGTFWLRAEAIDNLMGRGISGSAQIVVNGSTNSVPTNNILPVAYWIRPTNGNFVAGNPILMTARATDADGAITFVDFYNGGSPIGRASFASSSNNYYNATWTNPPAGTFFLRAVARDNALGRGTSAPVQIVITASTNATPTNVLPVVTWIRPTNGAVVPPASPLLLTARALDTDGTVSYVEFFQDSIYLGRGKRIPTNSNYTLTWTNPPAGTFQMQAEAVDNALGRGRSEPVEIVIGGGANGAVDLGVVEVPSIGHALFVPNTIPATNPFMSVVDYLVDQDQSSGGGGMLPEVSVNWDTPTQFKLTVSAPPGARFVVDLPTGRSARFGGFLWWESTHGGFSPPGSVVVQFTDLEGVAPMFPKSGSALSDSHGHFGFSSLESTFVTNSFTFTSIILTGTVAPQFTGNGSENYVPHWESSLWLSYSTLIADDPGRFVFIVAAPALPRIELLAMAPREATQLMIFGRPGRTHVVECSLDAVTWIPISTNLMPATVCAICPFAAVTDPNVSSGPSRFYRVVELP